ncbi:FecR domain-containing protein [Pseudomonas chlororaphis]|uniref:FecR protein n=1 Tax=Pseudomonas chlororaphis TaxID=587753 RepID=A0AAX3FVT8_9PSED|nr:FecR domain-containing protein [Pseudomonas chlororaphis]AZC39855.1 LysM domain protein [Pseudomonas chlororaphis subsp. piscium]AZC46412.1 LysM domain protein [Pseudomonas chlororaphis subsp. piscium]AZC59402.1 LysM domain protein [Pseudomonas chlororaphis subsp. piscium]WDG71919.1 FecR domain-containing protein [Pseudomonas chlororaphis]WDH30297.1 FecR domain-containing protein [Pseudomonas chlororaphis]
MRNAVFIYFSFSLGLSSTLFPVLGQADPINTQTHVVRQGETLWNIAKQRLNSSSNWPQIQKLNAIDIPRNLQVGSELNIPLQAQAFPVKVLYLQGRAWLIVKGQSEQSLAMGMTLEVGQSVRTGDASFVTLSFADGVLSVLPPRSHVLLSRDRQHGAPQIILQDGEVESYVPKRPTQYNSFEVTTPQGVLGVRGTHFRVRINNPKSSLVEVLDGRVVTLSSLSPSRKEVVIEHNQGLVFSSKGELHVKPLLRAPQDAEHESSAPGNPDWRIRTQTIPGAVAYFAQVSRSADFLNIEQDQLSPRPEFIFKGLEDAFYYVRIVAIDAQGLRGDPASFLLLHRVTNGAGAARNNVHSTHFNWVAPAHANTLRYHLQIADNASFNSPLIDQHDIEGTSITIKDLPPGTLYWRVESEPEQDKEQPALSLGSGILQ